jgi:hypothetical protein
MWKYYKEAFAAVQLATCVVSWTVYQQTHRSWGPTAIFFFSMEVSAVFVVMWASRLKTRTRHRTSIAIN